MIRQDVNLWGRVDCLVAYYPCIRHRLIWSSLSAETGIGGNAVHVGTYRHVTRTSKIVYLRSVFPYIYFLREILEY